MLAVKQKKKRSKSSIMVFSIRGNYKATWLSSYEAVNNESGNKQDLWMIIMSSPVTMSCPPPSTIVYDYESSTAPENIISFTVTFQLSL